MELARTVNNTSRNQGLTALGNLRIFPIPLTGSAKAGMGLLSVFISSVAYILGGFHPESTSSLLAPLFHS